MSINGTEASPASENEVLDQTASAVTDGASQDANPAQSSSADATDAKQEDQPSLDSIIRKAVEKPQVTEESSTPEAKSDEADPETGDGSDTPVDAEKADDDVPFHKHPRWQEMKQERDAYKQDADQYRAITNFMQQSNLTGEEVAQGFEIMALLKSGDLGNLSQARQWFAERLAGLDEVLGNQLPDDLKQKVDQGLVDEEVAKELARERANARNLQNLRTQDEQRAEQARAEEAQRVQAVRLATAVKQWEDGIKGKDPDYATKKAALVETQVLALIQRRGARPASEEEALALVDEAYRNVNETLKQFVPKPRPIAPTPAGQSARVTTAPQSLRAAIAAAVNR